MDGGEREREGARGRVDWGEGEGVSMEHHSIVKLRNNGQFCPL